MESLSSICAALAVGLFVMTFVFHNFVIPSGSMEKTLLIGDHVLVDRITFALPIRWAPFVHDREPQRGDVIVFLKPNPETPDLILVKRLIGVPGNRIHLVHGVVYLNGVAQNESYVAMPKFSSDPDDEYSPARDDFPTRGTPYGSFEVWSQDLPSHVQDGDLVVPPGSFFAMGDNREHSADGRFWGFFHAKTALAGRCSTTGPLRRRRIRWTHSRRVREHVLAHFSPCSARVGQDSMEQDRSPNSLALSQRNRQLEAVERSILFP